MQNYEVDLRSKSGEIRTLLLSTEVIEFEGQRCTVSVSKDISDRKQSEDFIRASLQEKEVLLKEIHHRVKNNLQIISSLLRLQSRSVEDELTQTLFEESQNRVQTMALIHEKLYTSENLAHVDFSSYVQSLAHDLVHFYQGSPSSIRLTFQIDDGYFDIDTAIPCGLIVNELMTNALKYAFPTQQGEIAIVGRAIADQRYELIVSDNGIGLPDSFDLNQVTTLGLRLVLSLTRQLNGTLACDRQNGTVIKIIFATIR